MSATAITYAAAATIGVTIGGVVPIFNQPHGRLEWTVVGCYMAFCAMCTTTLAWVTLR